MLKFALSVQRTPLKAVNGVWNTREELGIFFRGLVEVSGEAQSFRSGSEYPLAIKVLSLINPQIRLTKLIPLLRHLTGCMYAGHAVPKSDAALL